MGDDLVLNQKQVYLALDVGTSRLKGALVTRTGHTVKHEERHLVSDPVHSPTGETLWLIVQEVESLVAHLTEAAFFERLDIAALGLAAHMANALVLDESYEPLDDLMMGIDEAPVWAVEKARICGKAAGIDIHQHTGCPLKAHYPLPKLCAYAAGSSNTGRALHVGDLKSYLVWRWTKRFLTDLGSASASQLLDQRSRQWLDLPGLQWRASAYPSLCLPWDVVGVIGPSTGGALGLRAPVPLVVGTGDGIAASIGAGIPPIA